MHLFIFLTMRNHSAFFRPFVGVGQALFFNFYILMYFLSPKFSHRFAEYLEEEAVYTYTECIRMIDEGKPPLWKDKNAPEFAKEYYGLDDSAKMRDVLLNVRDDESVHRSVNRYFSDIP